MSQAYAFLSCLGPLGRRVGRFRQQSLLHLDRLFNRFLPPGLLAQAKEGPNSRERAFCVKVVDGTTTRLPDTLRRDVLSWAAHTSYHAKR